MKLGSVHSFSSAFNIRSSARVAIASRTAVARPWSASVPDTTSRDMVSQKHQPTSSATIA